jgi:hypothetical protein
MNPAWIGPAIGLISLSLAITFFLLGRRARLKGPTWAVRSNNLVRGFASSLPDLEILFRNEKVETLTVTRIAFWNRGRATIDANDIAPADPLRIATLGNSRLLDVKVVQINSGPSKFEALPSADGREALLRFDFLDHDHGAVLQIIHTGPSHTDLTVVGTIKGAGPPVKTGVRGGFLPLPTSAAFDRSIRPETRRRIARLCEAVALSCLVAVVSAWLITRLRPLQLAAIVRIWGAFEAQHRVLAGTLKYAAFCFGYLMSFVVVRALTDLGAKMLPVGLMSLVDDPLEK